MNQSEALPRQQSRSFSGQHWLKIALVLPALSGCGTPRNGYQVPEIPLPAQYQEVTRKLSSAPGQVAGAPVSDNAAERSQAKAEEAPIEWWRYFGNRELQGLIDRGLANNPDIRIALSHIVQAKARVDQATASKYPTLVAPLVAADQAPGGTTVGTAPAGTSGSGSTGKPTAQKTFQAGIRADWRLDIWGEQSALADSANFELQRAVHERENVQRNLAASLAGHYVDFLSLNDRLRIALDTEKVLGATLGSIEKRVRAGDATLSELEQQRAAIFSVRATIPTLEQQRLDAIGAMAFLVGTVRGNLALSDDGLDSLAIPSVLPGLPSALLLRRPDVRMAEAQLLAADANLALARARLLPPMDLSAQIGYSSIALSKLFVPQALFWSIADTLTVTLFDRGRRHNEVVFSQAAQEEMVDSYQRAVYQAMKEVESALASVRLAERSLAAHRETIQAARRAWDISAKVYGTGGIDYLTLLDTERSYHRYFDDYQKTRTDYVRSYISLFQALGGGPPTNGGPRPSVDDTAIAAAPQPLQPPAEGFPVNAAWGSGAETFWQVELAGLYHRSAIAAAWRDLINRYSAAMERRSIRPRIQDRIDDSGDGEQAWYRLYVAKFHSPQAAADFCLALNADQQRCRVISSDSDETVELPPQAAAEPSGNAEPGPIDSPAAAAEQPSEPHPIDFPAPASSITAERPAELRPANSPPSAFSITVERPAENRQSRVYTLQLATFAAPEDAAKATGIWRDKGYDAKLVTFDDRQGQRWYAVRAGAYTRKQVAAAALVFRHKERSPVAVAATENEDHLETPNSPADSLGPASVHEERYELRLPDERETAPDQAGAEPLGEPPKTPIAVTDHASAAPKVPNPPSSDAVRSTAHSPRFGAFPTPEETTVPADFWRGKGYDTRHVALGNGQGTRWDALQTGSYARREAALAYPHKEGAPALATPLQVAKPISSAAESTP